MARSWCNLHTIGALLIGLCLYYVMPHRIMLAGRNDFVHLYVGGSLYGSPDLYTVEGNQKKQLEVAGSMWDSRTKVPALFQRLPFYALLLKPLTWLPYFRAYILFQVLSLGCLLFFLWFFGHSNKDLLTLALMSPPLFANFILGQDVMLLVGLLTLTILLVRKDWDFAAGVVLSLCAIKPHLFLLVPAAVLLHRRWRMLQGAAIGGVVLAAIGLGSGGFAVYTKFFELLRNPASSPEPWLMPNLRGFVYSVTGGENIALLGSLWILTAAVVCFLAWRAESFEAALAYCLVGGVLVNPHAYMADCLLLLPALALINEGRETKPVSTILTIAALPFPYILLCAGAPYSPVFYLLLMAILMAGVWSLVGQTIGFRRLPAVPVFQTTR